MPLREVRIVSASSDPYHQALFNFNSVFRSIDFKIRFGIVSETKLPLIMHAPVEIPRENAFVCLYGCPWKKDMTPAFKIFSEVKDRLLSFVDVPARQDEFNAFQFVASESIGHSMRCCACFETNTSKRKKLLDEAYQVYEGLICATCHSSLISMVHNLRKQLKKAILFQPIPDLDKIPPEWRRMLSHCFAGMALCSMMGDRCPNLSLSLVSASLCCEKSRPLELAATLRMFPFLIPEREFKVSLNMSRNPAAIDAMLDEIFSENTVSMVGLSFKITDIVLLPTMLAVDRRDLFDQELGFIEPPDRRDKSGRFALAIHQRVVERRSAPPPQNSVHTHIVDGRILERKCAACGVWDTTGKNHSRCSGCMLVYYCGKECQLSHWKQHKVECRKQPPKC